MYKQATWINDCLVMEDDNGKKIKSWMDALSIIPILNLIMRTKQLSISKKAEQFRKAVFLELRVFLNNKDSYSVCFKLAYFLWMRDTAATKLCKYYDIIKLLLNVIIK